MIRLSRTLLLSAAAAVALACNPQPAHAAPLEPREHDPALAGLIAFSLQRFHYSADLIDDRTSSAWLDLYIESLDPNRMFFTADDIARFEPYRHTLDDAVNKMPTDVSAAFVIDRVYRERVEARLGWAMDVLSRPVALTGSGEVVLDREDAPWATSDAALDTLWNLRIEEQMVRAALRREALEKSKAEKDAAGEDTSKIKIETEAESREKLAKRYRRTLGDLDQQTSADVMEVFLGALGHAFDPHSLWFKPVSQENFNISMRDSLEGIGATLYVDGEYTVVRDLVAGGPAFRGDELKPGDRIVAVAQGDEEAVDVVDMRLDDVVKLIRGPKDTAVVLTVWPADSMDPADLSEVRIIRDKVVVAEAAAKGEVRDIAGAKVGIIDVPSFYTAGRRDEERSTSADLRRILSDFSSQGVDIAVVDLRSNGGGSLSQAIDTTGLFIEKGPVVQVKNRDGSIETYDDPDPGIVWDKPVVVLTSIFSASASEIFAGALQDYDRGLIVGAPATHGKGTVQELMDLSSMLGQLTGDRAKGRFGGALKFTTSQFYRVNGRSTQVEGVLADVVVPSLTDDLEYREGDLPGALPHDTIPAARFKRWRGAADTEALQAASTARVEASAAFAVLAELKALRDAREDEPLSLNLEVRRSERDESDALEKRWEDAGGASAETEDEDAADPWLDEALLVAVDYLNALR